MNPWLAAQRVLAVRLDNLGDVVMLGPALRTIKETSGAEITLLGSRSGVNATPLLPWIDDTITYRPIWQEAGDRGYDAAGDMEMIAALRDRQFDAAIIFTSFSQTPHVPGYFCYLAGIPLRAGESVEFGGRSLTHELRGTPVEINQAERNLRLVESLGFPVRDRQLEIALPPGAREEARRLLGECGVTGPYVLLHPGASADARRYPPERSGAVAAGLTRRGLPVLVTGTEREIDVIRPVLAAAPGAHPILDAGLPAFAALVAGAAVVVCNNTLPLHLADALRVPMVVLYSGTDIVTQWAPRVAPHVILRRPTPCTPCYRFDCPIGKPCLDIDPGEVVEAVRSLLPVEAAL